MSMITVDRAKYTKGKSGALHSGDVVAVNLDGLNLDQVYAVGAAFIKDVTEADLREKYSLNNPGQQRMHVGNRLRAAARKEGFMTSEFITMCGEFKDANEAAAAEAAAARKEEAEKKEAARKAIEKERADKAAAAKAEAEEKAAAKAKEKADREAAAKKEAEEKAAAKAKEKAEKEAAAKAAKASKPAKGAKADATAPAPAAG